MFLVFRSVICLLSVMIPPKKGLFIYGSWFGSKYGDNSKAVFEYMSKISSESNYWFTKNKGVASKVDAKGYQSICGLSLKSILLHLRAEAVFCNCSVNSDLLGMFLNRKTKVFNLWHGTPIKKIGKDAVVTSLNRDKLGVTKKNIFVSCLKCILPNKFYNFFKLDTYYLASSNRVASILANALEIDKAKIIICGYPKLDKCFQENNIKGKNTFKILYAPTYRGEYNSEQDILTDYGFNIKKANDVLRKNNVFLTIRLHPANRLPERLLNEIKDTKYINVDDNTEDVYESLNEYSLVMTDFSSVYFDALAIGLNVLIAPFGYQDYLRNDRDLYFSLNELYPNDMPHDWDEFFENFSDYTKEQYKELLEVRREFYAYAYAPCSKELLQCVNSILRR